MNYLAHAYFSNDDEGLLLGNFMADHIRGNHFEHLSEEIKKGIFLHRNIDQFTDHHEAFKQSKRFFYKGFEKYSGILVDIYFDHFLAGNFTNYHSKTLPQFTDHVYGVYQNNTHVLPDDSNRFLTYVLSNNIYNAYAKLEGIERVLYHLSKRIGHDIELNRSVELYKQHQNELQDLFKVLMNDGINQFLKTT